MKLTGYIKYYRRSLENPFFKNPVIWHFWGYCLLKATHTKTNIFINGVMIPLEPGQFVFGRKVASSETGLSEQQIRTSLKHLKKSENLTIQSTNRFSIISIVKWDTYQPQKDVVNQPTNHQLTSNQPAANHIQECKEGKEEITVVDSVDFKPTAEKIYQGYIKTIQPKRKSKQRAVKNITTWLNRGRIETNLISAYKNYAKDMSADPAYRKDPANFYGLNEDFAFDFLPINNEPETKHKPKSLEEGHKEEEEILGRKVS